MKKLILLLFIPIFSFSQIQKKEMNQNPMIKKKMQGTKITITASNDPRSYRQNSDKLLQTGFKQKYSVENAIDDIIQIFEDGKLDEGDNCFTVKWMKHLNLNIKI